MTNLPMFPEAQPSDDNTPLPLLVAKKWGFPLAFHIVEGKYMYAIQDWLRGLIGSQDIRNAWDNLKRQKVWSQMSVSRFYRMAYIASDGKTYRRDFTTAENLTVIMQHLRELDSRPILRDIKVFLNHQLVIQNEKRLSYEPVKKRDVEDSDIRSELKHEHLISDIKTKDYGFSHLLNSFVGRTQDVIQPHYYELITNDIYTGLWKRTPQQLKLQLGSSSTHLNKNHMTLLACSFYEMVCEMVKMKLASRYDLWWWEIRQCVKEATILVRSVVNQAEVFLNMDLATGRPLLTRG